MAVSPSPWSLIFDRAPGRDFETFEELPDRLVPVPRSFRIVDADNRLLVRIYADPEQTLNHEDMALIVELVNAHAGVGAGADTRKETTP